MRFSEVRLPQVIRQARETQGYHSESYNEFDGQLGRQILQEASQLFMTTMATLPPPNLRDTQILSLASITSAESKEQNAAVKEEPRRFGRRQPSNEPIAVETWPANPSFGLQSTPGVHLHPQMPSRSISSPTRPAIPAPPQAYPAYGYQPQIEPTNYYNFVPSDFEHTPYLTSAEFEAIVEDPDLYAAAAVVHLETQGSIPELGEGL